MHTKKHLKWAGIFFIFVAFCFIITGIFIQEVRYQKQKEIIQRNKIKNQRYTAVPYIEIPYYHLELLLKETVEKELLDKNYVGIWNQTKDLRRVNHIVLAGHNIKKVFGKLHQIPIGKDIKIHYKDVLYTYKIIVKKEVDVREMDYLKETTEKQITLITCTGNDQKRLLVIGKRV